MGLLMLVASSRAPRFKLCAKGPEAEPSGRRPDVELVEDKFGEPK